MKQCIRNRRVNPITMVVMLLAVPLFSHGQGVSIHFAIKNPTTQYIEIIRGDHTHPDRLFEKERELFVRLVDGKGTWTDVIDQPKFATAYYQDSVTKKYQAYVFYLSPGDDLRVSFDTKDAKATLVVGGRGAENNQPAIQRVINNSPDLKAYEKDSLPNNVFKAIQEISTFKEKLLNDYIAEHDPTDEFIRMYFLYTKYFPAFTFIRFKGNQKFNIRQAFERNEDKWQAIEDSIANVVELDNPEMLVINEYDYFLSNYTRRIKERLWRHPELLRAYYHTATEEEAVALKNADPENSLVEKVIDKHFSGRTAEFLYGMLFQNAIGENEDNLPEIFSRFRQKYPESRYIPYVEPAIRQIETRRERILTDQMIFVDNNAYQTFDDVLDLVEGKTVLLDMWGTWCGPCRSELSKNSDAIKSHFEDKGLRYLYIANHDLTKEAKWKELISYYNLTGTHILASSQLTKDIMKKIGGNGYPTYVIINKDGTFELSKAGYPMKREVLIQQLEQALGR